MIISNAGQIIGEVKGKMVMLSLLILEVKDCFVGNLIPHEALEVLGVVVGEIMEGRRVAGKKIKIDRLVSLQPTC